MEYDILEGHPAIGFQFLVLRVFPREILQI
jgi:hypothetical protein